MLWFQEAITPEWPEIFALKARRAPSSPPWPVGDEEAVALLVAVVESSSSRWSRRHLILTSIMVAECFESERRIADTEKGASSASDLVHHSLKG